MITGTMRRMTATMTTDESLADLYDQLATLQERVTAFEELLPIISEALTGLSNDNVSLHSKLTVQQLKQFQKIHTSYGIGSEFQDG
jgi:hypothetical protein